MRRLIGLLLCCCLTVCLSFTAIGCGDSDDEDDKPVNVGNIMQGGERPNYDEMFDFESGYTPPNPLDPNKMVTLSVDEKSPVLFANGEKTLYVKYNTPLTVEHFDLSGVEEGRELQGLSDRNEKGEYNFARDLESFRVPYNDTTIIPYFNAPVGYQQLEVGSSRDFNFNNINTGSFSTCGTIKMIDSAIISGGEGAYPELGAVINESSPITIGSAFRIDTVYPITDRDTVYAFKFNFENLGDTSIHMNSYQINSSSEHASSYKNRYRVNIDLEPGERMSVDYHFMPNGTNGNALTYMVANDDMDRMTLGISMSATVTELTAPETVNPTTKYTLTLEGNDIAFEDGGKTATLFERDMLPAVTNNNEYSDIIGWQDVKNPSRIWNDSIFELRDKSGNGVGSSIVSRFTMPAENITIAPLFAKHETRALIPASSDLLSSDNVSCERMGTKIYNTAADTGVGNRVGAEFKYSGGEGGSFTLVTSCALSMGSSSALKNTEHTFEYWFKNTGTESVTFTAHQVNSDGVKIPGSSMGEIVLAAGESKTVSVALALFASTDAYTLIELGKNHSSAQLGVVISKNAYNKYDLRLAGNDVSFEGDTKLAYVGSTMPLPTVTNKKTDTDIAGWYDVEDPTYFWRHSDTMLRDKGSGTTGQEVPKFAMPDKHTTIAPIFVEKGMRPLIPASGNGIDNATADMTVTRTTKLFETNLGMQFGAELSYSGNKYEGPTVGSAASATGRFRVVSSASEKSSQSGALLAGDHTFNFLFKNTGEETVKFTAYQVTSTTTLISGKNTGEITLAPGEVWTGSITVTLPGANNNAMTVITLGQNQTSAKLAMVLSTRYGTVK